MKNMERTKKSSREEQEPVQVSDEQHTYAITTETELPIHTPPAGLYKVRLVVGEVRRSLEFYTGFLGLRVAWTEERTSGRLSVACVELNETELILAGQGGGRKLPPAGKRGLGVALYLEVQGIGEWFVRAQERGYVPLDPVTFSMVQNPVERPGGEISFALRDPDGYDVRLSQLV